jgi:hypothetical protein
MFFRAAPLAGSLSAQHREAGLRLHELLAKRLGFGDVRRLRWVA